MSDSDVRTSRDLERTVVKTYVPAYQKERWREHADDLDMSQSEFVRSMVQAGRRRLDGTVTEATTDTGEHAVNGTENSRGKKNVEEPGSNGSNPRGNGLETQVLESLRNGTLSFDELLAEITDDIEDRLDETLRDLQSSGRIHYSGRHDGYVLVDE